MAFCACSNLLTFAERSCRVCASTAQRRENKKKLCSCTLITSFFTKIPLAAAATAATIAIALIYLFCSLRFLMYCAVRICARCNFKAKKKRIAIKKLFSACECQQLQTQKVHGQRDVRCQNRKCSITLNDNSIFSLIQMPCRVASRTERNF